MRTFILPQADCRIEVLRDKLYKAGIKYPSMDVQWRRDTNIVEVEGDWIDPVEDTVETIVAEHNPLTPTDNEQRDIYVADVLDRLNMSALADMTPTEIYTAMQNKMDAWANLGQAKADLMEWLPLMAAAIFWKVK